MVGWVAIFESLTACRSSSWTSSRLAWLSMVVRTNTNAYATVPSAIREIKAGIQTGNVRRDPVVCSIVSKMEKLLTGLFQFIKPLARIFTENDASIDVQVFLTAPAFHSTIVPRSVPIDYSELQDRASQRDRSVGRDVSHFDFFPCRKS